MKSISTLAFTLSLALGGATAAMAQNAPAPAAGPTAAPAPAPRQLSKGVQKAYAALRTAYESGDAAAYQAALTAANAAAKTPDDRYVIAQVALNKASKENDNAGQLAAMEAMLASGGARPDETRVLYNAIGASYAAAGNSAKASEMFQKVLDTEPGNTQAIWNLAEFKAKQKDFSGALTLVDQAMAAAKASGQPIEINWYKRALQFAYEGNLAPQTLQYSKALLTAENNSTNWRNALLIYRQNNDLDASAELDLLRLMRAAKGLDRENDYYQLASLLEIGNFPAEAVAVVNEGASTGKYAASKANFAQVMSRAQPKIAEDKAALAPLEGRAKSEATGRIAMRIADGYYGHANYAKAAEFYRVALQKGSVDANAANTRLGMALGMAGQKAEAEAAFKAVTGPRAGLAAFWMIWLSQRG